MKKTLVIGAAPNPERYAYKAAKMLANHNHEAVLYGIKKGDIDGNVILNEWPEKIENLDTVTLYIGPDKQPDMIDKILALHPKRIIFNPGTENPVFVKKAHDLGVETDYACTLVLLSTGQY
jgi:predicted CoA-binding protein